MTDTVSPKAPPVGAWEAVVDSAMTLIGLNRWESHLPNYEGKPHNFGFPTVGGPIEVGWSGYYACDRDAIACRVLARREREIIGYKLLIIPKAEFVPSAAFNSRLAAAIVDPTTFTKGCPSPDTAYQEIAWEATA